MKLRKKHIEYVALSALIIAAALVINLVILFPQAQALKKDVEQIQSSIYLLRSQANNVGEAQKALEEAAYWGKEIAVYYPFLESTSPLDVLFFLEEQAKATDNEVLVDIQEADEVTFNVRLTGTLNSLLSFLSRIEPLPAKIELTSIRRQEGLLPNTTTLSSAVSIIPFLPAYTNEQN